MEVKKPSAERLNPFALPTETDARFILLVLSAPALAFGVSQLLRYTFDANATNPFAGIQAPPEGLPLDVFFQAQARFGMQLMQATISSLSLPVLLIAIIFLLAAILYHDHPRRIRKRKGAIPYGARTDVPFEKELSALTSQAGLAQEPDVLLGKKLNAQDGQAFGVGRKKSLYLDGGLRLLLRKSLENFRAIVRHELAHVANGDIGRTYFAQSLWSAVIFVTILPLAGSALYLALTSTFTRLADGVTPDDLHEILLVKLPLVALLLLQAAGLILMVLLIRAGLLRTREVYADWRAALWGSGTTLASIFETQSRNRKATGLPLFRLHPTPAERLETLREPRRLFEVRFDVPFLTGVFTGLILNGFIPIAISLIISVMPGLLAFTSTLIDRAYHAPQGSVLFLLPVFYGLITFYWVMSLFFGLMPFLILAPLAAATIGLQVQRQTLADLAEGKSGFVSSFRLAIPAIWMGLGLVTGILLSPENLLAPRSATHLVLAFMILILFVFFSWLILVYTRSFSRRLLGSHTRRSMPRGKNRLLTVVVAILFLLVEVPLVVAYMIVLSAPSFGLLSGFLFLIGISVAMLFLLGLTFLMSWIVYSLYRMIRPVRCRNCAQIFTGDMVVGGTCQKCGDRMTPWLFVMR